MREREKKEKKKEKYHSKETLPSNLETTKGRGNRRQKVKECAIPKLLLLAAKEPTLLGLLLLDRVAALAGLAVVNDGLLAGRLGLGVDLGGLEEVAGAPPPGLLSTGA